jgi:hypothetical protein
MVFTACKYEHIYMARMMVAGDGIVEILYKDACMCEVDSVWYKEVGDNPICKRIGNEVEWCENDTFKILENGCYIDIEDKAK